MWHFGKCKTMVTVKGQRLPGAKGETWINGQRTEDFLGQWKFFCTILQCWLYVITHLSKLIESAAQRENPNMNYGLQLIILYQCWLFIYNKCTILMQVVNNRGNWEDEAYMGTLSTFCSIFSVNLKLLKKLKSIKKKKSPTWKGREAQLYPAFWSPLLRHSFTWMKPSWTLQPSTKWIPSSVYG